MNITKCPSLLADGYDTYSPKALKFLFSGKKVSHILPYDAPEISEDTKEKFIENRNVISVSGVQIKVGLIQVGNKLRLSESGEQSTHILKTAVAELPNGSFSCANEHLTMQLAGQVFGIETAANALIFFKNGEAAYITKRFDVLPNKMKLKMEDFASLAKKSPADGGNFKYDFSYAELGALIRKVVPAWHVEIEKFFSIVLFNYLFCNGDAHLKNFSVIQGSAGDYKLAPAYDLMNTRLHLKDRTFAPTKGLLADRQLSFVQRADFLEFAERIECNLKSAHTILEKFTSKESESATAELVDNSFLSPRLKQNYKELFFERLETLS